jgi:hypothetical protein
MDRMRTVGDYPRCMATLSPDVFVIRIWYEPVAGDRGRGRGYVEHIGSRQRRYFLELGDALDFVAAVSALPFRPMPGVPSDDEPCS